MMRLIGRLNCEIIFQIGSYAQNKINVGVIFIFGLVFIFVVTFILRVVFIYLFLGVLVFENLVSSVSYSLDKCLKTLALWKCPPFDQ